MYSIFVCVYLRKPQTTHESFIYGCPSIVVKDVLLYMQADYRKTCSYSLLFPSSLPKNMETETEPRSYEVTPDLSPDASVCGCVWVCVYVNQPFHSASSPVQPPKHPHCVLSWSQNPTNSLTRWNQEGVGICFSQVHPLGRKSPCTPVQTDLQWSLVSQHLVDIKSIVWVFTYFTIQWAPF